MDGLLETLYPHLVNLMVWIFSFSNLVSDESLQWKCYWGKGYEQFKDYLSSLVAETIVNLLFADCEDEWMYGLTSFSHFFIEILVFLMGTLISMLRIAFHCGKVFFNRSLTVFRYSLFFFSLTFILFNNFPSRIVWSRELTYSPK